MRSFSTLFLAAICAIGCGGSVDTNLADAAQDGTPSDADASLDAPPADSFADTGGDGGDCAACLPARVDWELNGGMAAWYDKSALLPCNTYQRQRFTNPTSTTPTQSCTSTVRQCAGGDVDASDSITLGEVTRALAHPDVQAALAKAPVLYGRDTRPVDGVVLRITTGGKQIEVGDDCAGASGCTEVPAGVKALVALLTDLDERKTLPDACPLFK